MNKKAFTLIELLAVIVILAIIALIAVPIVINIISDSKTNSQKRSIDGYARALKQASADYQIQNNKEIFGRFKTDDGKVLRHTEVKNDEEITTELSVNYKGNVLCDNIILNKNGTIYLSECSVDGTKIDYEYGETTYGMIMENKEPYNNFLNTGIYGWRISYFTIHNEINIPDGYEKTDCSYNQDESVVCYFKELENKPSYYDVHLAADGEIYTPVDSSYLFAYLGHQSLQNNLDVSKLNTTKTINMSYMFTYANARNFSNQKIILGDNFDTSNVTNMSHMFEDACLIYHGNFKFPDSFDTSNVTDMSYMFSSISDYIGLFDLGENFDTSKVTNMSHMFDYLNYIVKIDLGDKFNTSNVTNMSSMFYGFGSWNLKTLNLVDKFDTSKVTDMQFMFDNMGRRSLESFSLGNKFDTSNVTDMRSMFAAMGFEKLESFSLGDKFDTSNVINMNNMFGSLGYKKLKKLDLGKLFVAPTGGSSDVSYIFSSTGHDALKELYLWNFDFSRSNFKTSIFSGCGTDGVLTKIVVSNDNIKSKISELTSPNDVPQFWKDNDIIVVQSN